MKLIWLTDIHLNFLKPPEVDAFFERVAAARPGAVLVGGDISVGPKVNKLMERMAEYVGRPTYFVLGNHDFWESSVAKVREDATARSQRCQWLNYLGSAGVVELTPEVGLLGHDGWYDGRYGDYEGTNVKLNDFVRMEDFAYLGKQARLAKMQELAEEAAEYFCAHLPSALERFQKVIILTHVPPYREATWHEGELSGDDWLPLMSSKVVGDVLREVMAERPERELLVLCGHTHGQGEVEILPNLVVKTGGAVYGKPELQAPLVV